MKAILLENQAIDQLLNSSKTTLKVEQNVSKFDDSKIFRWILKTFHVPMSMNMSMKREMILKI